MKSLNTELLLFLLFLSLLSLQVGYTQVAQLHPTVLQRVRREDPAEYSIITHPHQYSRYASDCSYTQPLTSTSSTPGRYPFKQSTHSLTQRNFQGHQRSLPSEAQRLAREDVGRKELTGFSENTARSQGPSSPRDAPTPHTHYQQRSVSTLFYTLSTLHLNTANPLFLS